MWIDIEHLAIRIYLSMFLSKASLRTITALFILKYYLLNLANLFFVLQISVVQVTEERQLKWQARHRYSDYLEEC